jgi:hypothetical protein
MALYAAVTTSPPLTHLTLLPHQPSTKSSFPLTAHLSTHTSRLHYPFLVRAHYAHADNASPPSTWPAIDLAEHAEAEVSFIRSRDEAGAERRRIFVGEVPLDGVGVGVGREEGGGRRRVKFAVRYKIDRYAGWRWVESVGGICVGEVLVGVGSVAVDQGVERAIELAEGWSVTPAGAVEGAAKVFEVQSSKEMIPLVEDGTDAYGGALPAMVLGSLRGCVRWCSLVRLEPYWLGCEHGRGEWFAFFWSLRSVLSLSVRDVRSVRLMANLDFEQAANTPAFSTRAWTASWFWRYWTPDCTSVCWLVAMRMSTA